MSKELKKYKARIFGELYSIVSDKDDGFVLEVVQKVDSQMKEIASKHDMAVDIKKIAVLVALRVAEESLELQQLIRKEQALSEKIMELLDKEEISL